MISVGNKEVTAIRVGAVSYTHLDVYKRQLQHWSSMDDRLESVSEKMDTAEGHLARIAENTGVSAGHLGEIKDEIKKMIRDGLKVK